MSEKQRSSTQGTLSIVQVFGTPKCQETRKAVRFFKERGIRIQEINIKEKPPSPGELRSVASQLGWQALIDRDGTSFRNRGLHVAAISDKDIERWLLMDATLLRTPIVRCGKKATVGMAPEEWLTWGESATG